jgi:hypothetical protein
MTNPLALFPSPRRNIPLLLLLAIALLAYPFFARAQDLLVKPYPPTTWIGLRAGGSILSESLAEITGGASSGLKFGIDGGLDLEHWFNENWGIVTGLEFVQKGVDQKYSSTSSKTIESGDDNYSMNFVEIPVLLKEGLVAKEVGAGGGGTAELRPFLCLGPTFGFLASASEATSGTITPIEDPTSFIQRFTVSLYFGTGASFTFTGGPILFFDAGYETGLTNVFKADPPPRAFYSKVGQVVSTANEIIVTIGAVWEW